MKEYRYTTIKGLRFIVIGGIITGIISILLSLNTIYAPRFFYPIIMIIGIIILLVGFFLATISPWTSMEELKDDYDFENYSFRSYDPGDRVTIRGEITSENEYDYQGKKHYVYRLDDVEFGFLASDRVGDEGEVIIIECEVIELKIQNGSNV